MASKSKKSRKAARKGGTIVVTRATFNSREADAWCEQLAKQNKGAIVTRRRETFSFGVVYVVLAVRAK